MLCSDQLQFCLMSHWEAAHWPDVTQWKLFAVVMFPFFLLAVMWCQGKLVLKKIHLTLSTKLKKWPLKPAYINVIVEKSILMLWRCSVCQTPKQLFIVQKMQLNDDDVKTHLRILCYYSAVWLKGEFYPPLLLFISRDCYGVSCPALKDVCLLSSIVKLDVTQLVVLKAPKNTFLKLNSNVFFQKLWPSYPIYSTDPAVSTSS